MVKFCSVFIYHSPLDHQITRLACPGRLPQVLPCPDHPLVVPQEVVVLPLLFIIIQRIISWQWMWQWCLYWTKLWEDVRSPVSCQALASPIPSNVQKTNNNIDAKMEAKGNLWNI